MTRAWEIPTASSPEAFRTGAVILWVLALVLGHFGGDLVAGHLISPLDCGQHPAADCAQQFYLITAWWRVHGIDGQVRQLTDNHDPVSIGIQDLHEDIVDAFGYDEMAHFLILRPIFPREFGSKRLGNFLESRHALYEVVMESLRDLWRQGEY